MIRRPSVAGTIHPAQVAVPSNRDDIGKQKPVLEGQESEVDKLDKGPDHPVGLEGGPPGLVEPLLGARAFHGGHAAEEDTDHDGSKAQLIASDAGKGLEMGSARDGDSTSQEGEPSGGHWAEDACDERVSTYTYMASR